MGKETQKENRVMRKVLSKDIVFRPEFEEKEGASDMMSWGGHSFSSTEGAERAWCVRTWVESSGATVLWGVGSSPDGNRARS